MDESIGMIFAHRYQITRLLGVGSRKRVYLATDNLLRREVTLVLIDREVLQDDLSGVMHEAGTLAQVGVHDNIVVLYDYGAADGTAYLVFEYMSGGTLDFYVANRDGPGQQLAVDDVRRLGRQLARALAHVHERGVIHNGVAPGNVWLDDRQVAHLGGFDSSVRRGEHLSASHTWNGITRQYASPEQTAGIYTDERSDLYSFGAVLYFASTGEPPLRDKKGVVEPIALRQDLPRELNSLISELLSDSPNRRPTATQALELLKPIDVLSNRHVSAIHGPDRDLISETGKKAFTSWLETLPFPIASILWRYHAAFEPQLKVDNLVKFFEALTQFLVIVQLSAYIRDRGFFNSRSGVSPQSAAANSYRLDLRSPTFGKWVKFYQDFTGIIQRVLQEESDAAARCYELFTARSREQIELVANHELGRILHQAQHNRNSWIGHGGAASRQEHERRLTVLEELLRKTENILGATFETWSLLMPGYAAYAKGLYSLRAARLMGANPEFQTVEVPVRDPHDTNRLYLLNAPKSLELVPLMRVLVDEKTAQNACYFFNRIQAGETRWISYHYQAESELSVYDQDVMEFLSMLRRNPEDLSTA